MAIISSVIEQQRLQRNGSTFVREAHTDHVGKQHKRAYRAPAGSDINATMLARVPSLEADAKENELRQVYRHVIAGADWVTARDSLDWNTIDELETFVLKKVANRLRRNDAGELEPSILQNDIHEVIAFDTLFQSSGPRINTLLGLGSVADANEFRARVQDLTLTVNNYDVEFLPIFEGVD